MSSLELLARGQKIPFAELRAIFAKDVERSIDMNERYFRLGVRNASGHVVSVQTRQQVIARVKRRWRQYATPEFQESLKNILPRLDALQQRIQMA